MPRVPSGSVEIHYQDSGPRDGPPVVLLPGASLHELDGVGHLVPWEAPDETAAVIRKVLP